MEDQYFGTKELYEVVLKANTSMKMGPRNIEVGEPVLYFNNISKYSHSSGLLSNGI